MKVETVIDLYGDDTATMSSERETIIVKSHWTFHDRVILVVDGKEYTVISDQLRKAITNAENH